MLTNVFTLNFKKDFFSTYILQTLQMTLFTEPILDINNDLQKKFDELALIELFHYLGLAHQLVFEFLQVWFLSVILTNELDQPCSDPIKPVVIGFLDNWEKILILFWSIGLVV